MKWGKQTDYWWWLVPLATSQILLKIMFLFCLIFFFSRVSPEVLTDLGRYPSRFFFFWLWKQMSRHFAVGHGCFLIGWRLIWIFICVFGACLSDWLYLAWNDLFMLVIVSMERWMNKNNQVNTGFIMPTSIHLPSVFEEYTNSIWHYFDLRNKVRL